MTATVSERAKPTPLQVQRKVALMNSGKDMKDVAREIAESDGKPCTRQAVEAVVMDRWATPSERIAFGFCKAVGMEGQELALFPTLRYKRANRTAAASDE
jgi:hypothetical protein